MNSHLPAHASMMARALPLKRSERVAGTQGRSSNNLLQRALANPNKLAPADLLQLQRSAGNQAVQGLLKRGSGENSAAEGAAEAAATKVAGGGAGQRSGITSSASSLVTPEIERSINGRRGQGEALPAPLQQRMEGALNADLGGVRLHTDAEAGQISRSLEARAFTSGRDIFFKEGEYNPTGSGGQRLIAHELAHVVQQSGGTPTIQRVTDEYLQTNMGKGKYNKVVTAKKLAYFLSLEEDEVDAYKLMPHTEFDKKLKGLPSVARKKKKKGGTLPNTPSTTPKIEATETEPSKTEAPKTEPPKVDPEVEKQMIRELVASDFESNLTPLLSRFDTVDISKDTDVNSLLDTLIGGPVITLFNEGMLRRSDNLKKVIDKLHGLLVTAWTHNKTAICDRIKRIFTDMHLAIPKITDFSGDKDIDEKLTQGKELVATRTKFINEQRAAAKDVANPSLKVSDKLTLDGHKVLTWYEEATKAQLSQFYDSTSLPARSIQQSDTRRYGRNDRQYENLTINPGNWLDVWAQLKWKEEYIKNNIGNYGKFNPKYNDYNWLGSVHAGSERFNIEDKLWVKQGTAKATRYNDLGDELNTGKTSQSRATALRKVVSGDLTSATRLEMEGAMAMLGAETARNPRSYGIGLMLLDLMENEGTYGSKGKKYNFSKLLGSSPHDRESESGFENRKTQASLPKQQRWLNMKNEIDTKTKFSSSPFKALWAGKWSMSPSGSMALGTTAIPTSTAQLNTVQYKELKTILNWYINFMKGAQLNVKDETEAKNSLVKLFKDRLGKTAKMGAGSFKTFFA